METLFQLKKGEKGAEIPYVGLDVVTPDTSRSFLAKANVGFGIRYGPPSRPFLCRRWPRHVVRPGQLLFRDRSPLLIALRSCPADFARLGEEAACHEPMPGPTVSTSTSWTQENKKQRKRKKTRGRGYRGAGRGSQHSSFCPVVVKALAALVGPALRRASDDLPADPTSRPSPRSWRLPHSFHPRPARPSPDVQFDPLARQGRAWC